jgi:hypothetical protein
MAKGTPKGGFNKSQWIREQPRTLTPKEVVEKAAKKDIQLSVQQVYTVRYEADKKAKAASDVAKPAVAAVAPAAPAKPGPKPKLKANGTELITAQTEVPASVRQQFFKLAFQIGSIEAKRLIQLAENGFAPNQ